MIVEYKELPNYGGRYEISSTGEVFDKVKNIVLKKRYRKDGYYDVWLNGPNKTSLQLCHRLVLMAFKGMPTKEKPLARHLNGVRTDNYPFNLAWGDYIENRADRKLHGTSSTGIGNIGEKCKTSVLKNNDVYEIKHIIAHTNFFDKEIALMYGVKRECINKISRGVRWKHISI